MTDALTNIELGVKTSENKPVSLVVTSVPDRLKKLESQDWVDPKNPFYDVGSELAFSRKAAQALVVEARKPRQEGKVFDGMFGVLTKSIEDQVATMKGEEFLEEVTKAPRPEGQTFTHNDVSKLTLTEKVALVRVLHTAQHYGSKEGRQQLSTGDYEAGLNLVAGEFMDAEGKREEARKVFHRL